MPTGQPAKNVQVIYKTEGATYGTKAAAAAPSEVVRIHAGPSFSMERGWITDPEVRRDGQRSMARLGMKEVTGGYAGTLSVGTWNTFLSYLFRHAWAADVVVTYNNGLPLTSIEVNATNQITMVGTTTLLASGLRVGDVFRLASMSTPANDNVNCVVKAIDATGKIATILGSPLTIQIADADCTLTIKKKLKNALGTPADPMVRSSYTFEERYDDNDESKMITGVRIGSLKVAFTPTGVVELSWGLKAQDLAIEPTGTSPYFLTPTEYTSIGLIAADATIYIAGAAIAVVTGGELTFDIGLSGIDCVGSLKTPDLFEGAMAVSGQITVVSTAFTASHLARFLAETDNVELSLMFVEPETTPTDFLHIFVPRLKYAGVTMDFGGEGPLVETIPVKAGCKATTTGYDSVVATISTSA